RRGIGQADRAAEDSLLLQLAYPPPHRGGRCADPFGKRGMAEAGIALQLADDSPVDGVEVNCFSHGTENSATCVSHPAPIAGNLKSILRIAALPLSSRCTRTDRRKNGRRFSGRRQAHAARPSRSAEG